MATKKGSNNIAFAARLLLGQKSECIDVLLDTDRAPEAALFARTYAPSLVGKSVNQWKKNLGAKGKKIADSLADPTEHPEAFEEGWEESLEREAAGQQQSRRIEPNGHSHEEHEEEEDEEDEAATDEQLIETRKPAGTPDIVLSPPAEDGENGLLASSYS